MCRHLAYLGPPATLASLLIDPPHSLYRQAWAPRRQRYGTVNADGFGIGWYVPGDPVPARYRRGVPIWGDESLADLARVTRSGAVLAAVRSATAGTAHGADAAAPFGSGRWLFSHNGAANNWRDWAEQALVRLRQARGGDDPRPGAPGTAANASGGIGPSVLSAVESLVDSAVLWALVLDGLRAGCDLGGALAATIAAVAAAGGTGRFNLLLTDGRSVAATACGDTLCYREADGGLTVASEPDDDQPGWTEVPDKHLLTATAGAVRVRPLAQAAVAPLTPITMFTGSTSSTSSTSSTDSDVRTEGIVIA